VHLRYSPYKENGLADFPDLTLFRALSSIVNYWDVFKLGSGAQKNVQNDPSVKHCRNI
jgi:hypothetical protein